MAMRISGKPLFAKTFDRDSRPRRFGFLIRPTRAEHEEFVVLLDKMIVDNLNREFFTDKVGSLFFFDKKDGIVIRKQKGTISLLEEWLSKIRFQDPSPFLQMIRDFRSIHEQRHPLAHTVAEDAWDNKYFGEQRELMMKACGAIRTLRLILTNYPEAKEVEVPDWLFEAKIWTF